MELILKNISKTIKDATVLEDISLTLSNSKVYGLKGKNGSGKTMLMRLICNFIAPTSGELFIDKTQVKFNTPYPISIGALIETPAFLDDFTGYENLKFLSSLQKQKITKTDIKDTLALTGLVPDDTRTYKKYSLGMKQRLGIAAAILGYPQIVILDEPTNALDTDGIELLRKIIALLKQHGCLVILSCHDSEELYELSDVIITLKNGKIIDVDSFEKEDI